MRHPRIASFAFACAMCVIAIPSVSADPATAVEQSPELRVQTGPRMAFSHFGELRAEDRNTSGTQPPLVLPQDDCVP